MSFELGLATFADLRSAITPRQRMSNLLDEARLADERTAIGAGGQASIGAPGQASEPASEPELSIRAI